MRRSSTDREGFLDRSRRATEMLTRCLEQFYVAAQRLSGAMRQVIDLHEEAHQAMSPPQSASFRGGTLAAVMPPSLRLMPNVLSSITAQAAMDATPRAARVRSFFERCESSADNTMESSQGGTKGLDAALLVSLSSVVTSLAEFTSDAASSLRTAVSPVLPPLSLNIDGGGVSFAMNAAVPSESSAFTQGVVTAGGGVPGAGRITPATRATSAAPPAGMAQAARADLMTPVDVTFNAGEATLRSGGPQHRAGAAVVHHDPLSQKSRPHHHQQHVVGGGVDNQTGGFDTEEATGVPVVG